MKRQERARLARITLDFHYMSGGIEALSQRPTHGWIRAVRDALGMTGRQLGERMELSQPAVTQLERSEADGVIQLDSLRRVAAALDCDLVYALVPRTSLEKIVSERAALIARTEISAVNDTMQLDGHGLGAAELKRRTDEYAADLIAKGRLWDDPDQR